MYTANKPDRNQIERFLQAVDASFPIPLSEKQSLSVYAEKLYELGTVCAEVEDGEIVSMVAGYTDHVEGNRGYISMVATTERARGRGLAKKLVLEFIRIAADKGLEGVHLYAVADNLPAIRMYQGLGFTEFYPKNEPRPDDTHLIYYMHADDSRRNGDTT